MRALLRVLPGAAVVLGLSFCSTRAWSAPIDAPMAPPSDANADANVQNEAAALMRSGVEAYRKGNLEGAREAFEKAWKLRPHLGIAASLADVEMKLGRYRDAAVLWRYYLAHRPPDPSDAERQLSECMKHIGRLHVSVNKAGAAVLVDGEPVGSTPLREDVLLEPGSHTVVARFDDRSSSLRPVTANEGERTSAMLIIPPPEPLDPSPLIPAAPPAKTPTISGGDRAGGISARTWVLLAGGALTLSAGAIGIVYAVKMGDAEDDATRFLARTIREGAPSLVESNSQCAADAASRPAACDDLARALDDRNRAARVANGAIFATGFLGVATAATFLLWPSGQTSRPKEAAVNVSPWTTGGVRGLQIEGRF